MNERIRELAEQAEEYADSMVDEGSDFHPEYTQKLTELIIRECMDNLAWHGHDEAVSQLEWFKLNKLGIK